MRDEHYRRMCYLPSEYDDAIDFIMANNPACTDEAWACNVVHATLSMLMYPHPDDKEPSWGGTGGVTGVVIKGRDKRVKLLVDPGLGKRQCPKSQPNNTCPKCGLRIEAETGQDERDGSGLCWCGYDK